MVLPDLQRDPRISLEAREFYARASIVSGATFPLLVHDEIIGLLRVGSLKPTDFPQTMVALIEELAVQAAMVVNGIQLHEEQERAERALRASEERFRSLVQNASDLITVIEADTNVIYQSPSIQRALGYEAGDVVGRKLLDLVHPDDVPRIVAFLREAMRDPTIPASVEAQLRHRDGSWRYVEINGADRRHDANVSGFVLNSRDVSERKQLEEELRHQAFHDPLTKLANRASFTDRLEHSLLRATREARAVAVVFMDLDNFKSVNDSLGHNLGDEVLIEVAARVRSNIRPGDTAARFGGDEFAILLDEATLEDAKGATARIMEGLQEPFHLDGKNVLVAASFGIACSTPGQRDADTILRNADIAMYVAKDRGKGRAEVYQQNMHSAM
ncbi:MAG: diguanylate cyclase, partial [Dehalococcoidia bacterium]